MGSCFCLDCINENSLQIKVNFDILRFGDIMKLTKIIEDISTQNLTIGHVLKNELKVSSRLIKKLKTTSGVLKNGVFARIKDSVSLGDVIEITIPEDVASPDLIPENIPLDIIFEDDFYIVINKRPGVVVHPTTGHFTGTLANGLLYYFMQKGLSMMIRPVNRLDKDTSGVVIFAKSAYAQEYIIRQMRKNECTKNYLCVVHGTPAKASGIIDAPIGRKPDSIMLRYVTQDGDRAVTHYTVLKQYLDATLLKISLETGRTHQIRVHFTHLGLPIIGDTLYSDRESSLIQRQALHSFQFSFFHPISKRKIILTAKLPNDIRELIKSL